MVLGEFFSEIILPFLLVFVVVFAILQKSKILGQDKRQIDALVALAIGLLLVTVPFARTIVIDLMPWIAVGIAVLLTFFILYAFVGGNFVDQQGATPKWMKVTFGTLIGIFTLLVVLYVTGLNDLLYDFFSDYGDGFFSQALLIAVVVGAFAVAVATGKGGNGGGSGGSSSPSRE